MTAPGGDWLTGAGVMIVAGPGGVGSGVVAAAISLAAAERGADALLVPIGPRPHLSGLLGVDVVDGHDREVRRTASGGCLRCRTIPRAEAFASVLEMGGLRGIVRRATTMAALPLITAAAPDLEPVLTLARVVELAEDATADVVVVSAPPVGRAAELISAAERPRSERSDDVEGRAAAVRALLADPARCRTVLVATPDWWAVDGAVRLADRVRSVRPAGPSTVVVNRACATSTPISPSTDLDAALAGLPDGLAEPLGSTLAMERHRRRVAADRIDRLRSLASDSSVTLPRLPHPAATVDDLAALAAHLVEGASGG